MRESATTPDLPPTERPTPPPYSHIATGLTRLLAETGLAVRDGFLPHKQLSSYDYDTRSLVLHPWIAPKQRAAILLSESVQRLAPHDEEGVEEQVAWRRWRRVEATVARHYGMATDAEDARDELTPGEQSLVARIVGAVEAAMQPD